MFMFLCGFRQRQSSYHLQNSIGSKNRLLSRESNQGGSPYLPNLNEYEASILSNRSPQQGRFDEMNHDQGISDSKEGFNPMNSGGWSWDQNAEQLAYSARSGDEQMNMYTDYMNQVQQDQFKHYYEHLFQRPQGTLF